MSRWWSRVRILTAFACVICLCGCGLAKPDSDEDRDPSPGVRAVSDSGPPGDRSRNPEPGGIAVVVSRAVEGDTVEIKAVVYGLSTVRLIGVDTPSPDQPHGDEAREFTADNLVDREILLEFDAAPVDRYGRLLAYARLPDGAMFNELLAERGHAQVATFPPNTRHAGLFRAAQDRARESGLGLWGLGEEDLCRQTDRGNGIGGGCPEPPPEPDAKAAVNAATMPPAEPAPDAAVLKAPEAEVEKAPEATEEPEITAAKPPADEQPPEKPAPRPLPAVAPVADRTVARATLVGAGDVGDCTGSRDEATARLLARTKGTVFTLGDNAQDAGAAGEFAGCYGPSWGRFKARTRPAVGNHEYGTDGATPYYDYFGASAGPPGAGFYSYDRGGWHVVVLNSNCDEVGGCGPGSPQLEWLKQDLDANPSRCTLAYFHHPLFSSARGVETVAVLPFWRVLHDRGAELVLNGHAHSYERFDPQTPDGRRDPRAGIRQIVVGTGGEPPRGPLGTTAPNSAVRNDASPGVLKLDLAPASYRWRFLPVAGKTFTDSGAARCH